MAVGKAISLVISPYKLDAQLVSVNHRNCSQKILETTQRAYDSTRVHLVIAI